MSGTPQRRLQRDGRRQTQAIERFKILVSIRTVPLDAETARDVLNSC